jgi:general secretion pathway protein I
MRHRNAGFTLLEMLVALAILAVALMASFRALTATIVSADSLHAHLLGDWVAANRLAELRANNIFPETGSAEGEARQAGRVYQWHEVIKATPNPLFRRVDIEVYAESGGNAISRLSGYVASPLR